MNFFVRTSLSLLYELNDPHHPIWNLRFLTLLESRVQVQEGCIQPEYNLSPLYI
jgi:hypothetical protein